MSTITERQCSYLLTLLDERDLLASPKFRASIGEDARLLPAAIAALKTDVPHLTKSQASDWIGRLVGLPKKQKDSIAPNGGAIPFGAWTVHQHEYAEDDQNHPNLAGQKFLWMQRSGEKAVPRGSYAIERSSLRFPGAFTNDLLFFSVWIRDDGQRWSVKMYVSDELVKISRSLQYDVLSAIALDPAAAASRYGHEIGKCGICGRKLTNDISRERGIGPVCAEKWGW